jgi:hypothetical protein
VRRARGGATPGVAECDASAAWRRWASAATGGHCGRRRHAPRKCAEFRATLRAFSPPVLVRPPRRRAAALRVLSRRRRRFVNYGSVQTLFVYVSLWRERRARERVLNASPPRAGAALSQPTRVRAARAGQAPSLPVGGTRTLARHARASAVLKATRHMVSASQKALLLHHSNGRARYVGSRASDGSQHAAVRARAHEQPGAHGDPTPGQHTTRCPFVLSGGARSCLLRLATHATHAQRARRAACRRGAPAALRAPPAPLHARLARRM